jgi:hypothetical protein
LPDLLRDELILALPGRVVIEALEAQRHGDGFVILIGPHSIRSAAWAHTWHRRKRMIKISSNGTVQ